MVLLLCTSVASAIGCYIAALRSGLSAKRWAIAALCLGPLVLPLFQSHKRLALRQVYAKSGRLIV